jgi:SSS family solute:Na+ symporter
MRVLPVLDFTIIGIYLIAMVLVGFYFSRKNKNAEQFTVASGFINPWGVGLSIY